MIKIIYFIYKNIFFEFENGREATGIPEYPWIKNPDTKSVQTVLEAACVNPTEITAKFINDRIENEFDEIS